MYVSMSAAVCPCALCSGHLEDDGRTTLYQQLRDADARTLIDLLTIHLHTLTLFLFSLSFSSFQFLPCIRVPICAEQLLSTVSPTDVTLLR